MAWETWRGEIRRRREDRRDRQVTAMLVLGALLCLAELIWGGQ